MKKCPVCQRTLTVSALAKPSRIKTCTRCKAVIELRPHWPGLILSIVAITTGCGLAGQWADSLWASAGVFVLLYPLVMFFGFTFKPLTRGTLKPDGKGR